MDEDMQLICDRLCSALQATRVFKKIDHIAYNRDSDSIQHAGHEEL